MSEAATHDPAATQMLGWEVRRARPGEAAAVAEGVAALLVELGATPPSRDALEVEASAHIADPSLGIVLVATTDAGADPAGVLAASWARAIQIAGRLATIEVLWTREESRGQGVGAALVEALMAAAAAEGAGRVEVGLPREGFASLAATERFYRANGFERVGPRMRRAFR